MALPLTGDEKITNSVLQTRERALSSLLPSDAVHTIQLTCLAESLHVEIGPNGCSDSTLCGTACQLLTCSCCTMETFSNNVQLSCKHAVRHPITFQCTLY